ncbi:hypothetical protein QWI17_09260 [Gilvimarinus sp. SDUM040013]|uniref:Uncharacterized protein n=1 Tax=Gilvimarinus gilvus TaxID=3058038 RepID=A0ABU4S038_9GAMM|nr:hypothetical protein [Gilvimarinus sp. SDUM040013]MDO3386023.1 hypothetical protein [Gilvimarinus sp. SDUM040013]MDX6850477.1 hypothetical protein [Gilvimarinus sp. SDUM040013]
MKDYSIRVVYKMDSGSEKIIDLKCDKFPAAYLVDSFVLESIVSQENPDVEIYPLLKDYPRGSTARNKMPSNKELMRNNGIISLHYEIEGVTFEIST